MFIVFLADQHRKRSCLAEASTCFWTQGTEHLQQVTQSPQFQPVLVLATLLFTGTMGTSSVETPPAYAGLAVTMTLKIEKQMCIPYALELKRMH